MGIIRMSEPVTTGIGFGALVKAYGLFGLIVAVFMALVYFVVIMTRMPRTRAEWAIGLITTVVSSLTGGSFLIIKYGLHAWSHDFFGMMALGGFYFIAGLPGWALVRWTFNYINKHENSTILDVGREIKEELKK